MCERTKSWIYTRMYVQVTNVEKKFLVLQPLLGMGNSQIEEVRPNQICLTCDFLIFPIFPKPVAIPSHRKTPTSGTRGRLAIANYSLILSSCTTPTHSTQAHIHGRTHIPTIANACTIVQVTALLIAMETKRALLIGLFDRRYLFFLPRLLTPYSKPYSKP